jgi:hypothetical protein
MGLIGVSALIPTPVPPGDNLIGHDGLLGAGPIPRKLESISADRSAKSI